MILKLKKLNFTTTKILFFRKLSNKTSSGQKNYKYFIGYLYNDNTVKALHKMLPKISAYVKSYDIQTKWMYFLIKDDDLLKKYKNIWDKLSADLRKKNLTANLLIIKIKSQKKKKKTMSWR